VTHGVTCFEGMVRFLCSCCCKFDKITRNKAMADILDPEEDESLGQKEKDEEEMGS
jgi:hypothetical protein